jgi:hypothetical protein
MSTSQTSDGWTVHCPECDGTEFYAEVEVTGTAWAPAEFVINNGEVSKVEYDDIGMEDEVTDSLHATGIIQCNNVNCRSDLNRKQLVLKKNGEKQNAGPRPGKGQINLITGEVVK